MGSAAAHFTWARDRALEYADMGNATAALNSLTSDLGKHPGTAGILHPGLQRLFVGEVLIGGADGARRFITGLPVPADGAEEGSDG